MKPREWDILVDKDTGIYYSYSELYDNGLSEKRIKKEFRWIRVREVLRTRKNTVKGKRTQPAKRGTR